MSYIATGLVIGMPVGVISAYLMVIGGIHLMATIMAMVLGVFAL